MYRQALKAVGAAVAESSHAWSGDGWRVRRVRSGLNNALYRVDGHGRTFACKLCVADERERARREVAALSLLERLGVDVAPGSAVLDESLKRVPLPAAIYDWLPGGPPAPQMTAEQLDSLLDALHALHAVAPGASDCLPEAWFHWFDREPYLQELAGFEAQYLPWVRLHLKGGAVLSRRLERLVERCAAWVRSRPVELSRTALPLRLCHVDPNPGNMIWGPDGHMRWVDWEYAGWGDPALDLAEYRWHAGWLAAPEDQHDWLRANYAPPAGDDTFWERLAVWDRLLAARWPFLVLRWLYSARNGSDRMRLTVQDVHLYALQERLERLMERAEGLG